MCKHPHIIGESHHHIIHVLIVSFISNLPLPPSYFQSTPYIHLDMHTICATGLAALRQDCWYLLKPQFTSLSTVKLLVRTHSCTPWGHQPLRPLARPQGGHVASLRAYESACQSATWEMSSAMGGRMDG